MCLVLIAGRCFSGVHLLASKVSEELGYRFLEEDAVMQRAAAWGLQGGSVEEVLKNSPFWPFRAHQRRGALAVLRAALAEEVAPFEAVYCGCEAYLLPRDGAPILRIRLNTPLECRMAAVGQRLRLYGAAARRYIRHSDHAYCKRVRAFCGLDDGDPALYDLALSLNHGDIESAAKCIATFVTNQRWLETGSEYRMSMADLALASRIEALVSLLPHAEQSARVTVDSGLVFLTARRWRQHQREMIRAIVLEAAGVRRVEFVERCRPKGHWLGRVRSALGWRSWAMGSVVLSVLLVGLVVLNQPPHHRAQRLMVLKGFVTDTRCGAAHRLATAEPARCIRECVTSGGQVRYALFDGTQVYSLSDQALGDRFAARAVTVMGTLEQNGKVLQTRSIEADPER